MGFIVGLVECRFCFCIVSLRCRRRKKENEFYMGFINGGVVYADNAELGNPA